MLQYKIPQNVGIEDKIVGPFSLRQLIILGVGFGISYTLFALSSRIYELNALEYIIIAIPGLIALAAALIKIKHVSFTKFLLLTLEFAINPKKRYWNHHAIASTVDPDLTEKTKMSQKAGAETRKNVKNVNLRELSITLDSGGYLQLEDIKHEDIDNVDDDDLITQAYFGHRRKEGPVHNMYWRTRDVQKKKLDLLAKLPSAKIQSKPNEPVSKETPQVKTAKPKSDLPDLSLPVPQPQKTTPKKVVAVNNKTAPLPTPPLPQKEQEPEKSTHELVLSLNLKEAKFKLLNHENQVIATEKGAQIKPYKDAYDFVLKLAEGSYQIIFDPVEGHQAPENKSLELNQRKIIRAKYRKITPPAPERPKRETQNKAEKTPAKLENNKKPNAEVKAKTPQKKKAKKDERKESKTQNRAETLKSPVEKKTVPPPSTVHPVKEEVKEVVTTLNDLKPGQEIEFKFD